MAGGSDLIELLCAEGLAKTLLGMLAQLRPITTAGRRPREGDDARGPLVAVPSVPGVAPGRWPAMQPYEGYRSDIVSGTRFSEGCQFSCYMYTITNMLHSLYTQL